MLNRETLEAAFTEMGQYLRDRRQLVDLAVYGGCAMLLEYSTEITTNDADVVVTHGHGPAIEAAHAVAKRRGWPTGWFNEQVSTYVVGARQDLRYFRAYPSDENPGLRVYLAPPLTLLAMKLAALRTGSRDEDDAVVLARKTGLKSVEALLDLYREYQNTEPDARRIVAIGEVARRASSEDAS